MKRLVQNIVLLAHFYAIYAQSIKDLIANKEQITTGITSEVERLYRFRCDTYDDCGKSCSDSACAMDFTNQPTCSTVFGGYESFCGAGNSGQWLNYKNSTLTFSPGLSSKDLIVRESVCAFRPLDNKFASNKVSFNHSTWQYFGDANGVFRYYPGYARGFANNVCRPFEHRARPWYIAAATGPKDVVIVIDRSGSMNQPASALDSRSRLDVVKNAVRSLLDTFTFTDYVSVVSFSTSSTIVGGNTTLLRADAPNLLFLKNEVDKMVATGDTNFELGLTDAFNLLGLSSNQTSSDHKKSSGCQKVILFLTDGDRTAGVEPVAFTEAQQKILASSQNCTATSGACRASIFTFTIGTDITSAGNTETKNLACANKGVWAKINQGEDPFISMSAYFKFLALGTANRNVIWTTPYEDDFGLGLVTTAAQPVYDDQKILIGVAASDILVSDLQKSLDYQVVFNELITQSSGCRNQSLTTCQLQFLRQNISPDSVCSTGPDATNIKVCSNTDNAVLHTCNKEFPINAVCTDLNKTTDLKQRNCCSNTGSTNGQTSNTGVIAGSTIAGVVVVALIVFVVWFFIYRKKKGKSIHSGHQSVPKTDPNVDISSNINDDRSIPAYFSIVPDPSTPVKSTPYIPQDQSQTSTGSDHLSTDRNTSLLTANSPYNMSVPYPIPIPHNDENRFMSAPKAL
ncbi:hypothetical protein HK096_011012 [Nowakowskiella sp. JEL0078]|nr:hypothetical protein HK096_011012 [Nowakowskiella sp. JEL0078]